MSLHANIFNKSYDQKSQQHMEVDFLRLNYNLTKFPYDIFCLKDKFQKFLLSKKLLLHFDILFNCFVITLIDFQVLKGWG